MIFGYIHTNDGNVIFHTNTRGINTRSTLLAKSKWGTYEGKYWGFYEFSLSLANGSLLLADSVQIRNMHTFTMPLASTQTTADLPASHHSHS